MYFNFFTYKILFKPKIYLLVFENSACLIIQTDEGRGWGKENENTKHERKMRN